MNFNQWKKLFIKKVRTEKPPRYQIVMVRQATSEWNERKLIIGWYNSDLSPKGEKQARYTGDILKNTGFKFDMAFSSVLTRAKSTLKIILEDLELPNIPTEYEWRLNGRHFGAYTGMRTDELVSKLGRKKWEKLNNSFDELPPPMDETHKYYKSIVEDPTFIRPMKRGLSLKGFPQSESLEMVMERVMPFWKGIAEREIKLGKLILLVAHSESLRAIIKHLDNLSDKEIENVKVPKSIPFLYTTDEDLVPVENGSFQFIAEKEDVKKAIDDETTKS